MVHGSLWLGQGVLLSTIPDVLGAMSLSAVAVLVLRGGVQFSMSMYKAFRTDAKLEQEGIQIDYGDFVVTVARAGGANERFNKKLRQVSKPYKRAMETGKMPEALNRQLYRDTFAETVVLNWHRRIDGELVRGIEAEDGSTLEFNAANVIATFEKLPDLYSDLVAQSQQHSNFQHEDEAGN